MGTIASAIGAALSACAVWLTVRIINRRERWATRTLAGIIGLPVLYLIGFGPGCWMADRKIISIWDVDEVYRPLTTAMIVFPRTIGRMMRWYGEAGSGSLDDEYPTVRILVMNERLRRLSELTRRRPPVHHAVNPPAPTPDAPSEPN